jgi:N-acetylglutamate synthase-like GNAT family acetyltransferase
VRIRAAKARDLDALVELESRVFATDRLSRRSLRRFLTAESAAFMVAERARRWRGSTRLRWRRT